MLLRLKDNIIYGPVKSRRLGQSLGINILPAEAKICTFNCIYCQYGWTDFDKLNEKSEISWPSIQQVAEAIERWLIKLPESPDFITLSGNGEPTLHPDFPQIVDVMIDIRNRLCPSSKTAILSNSTNIFDRQTRQALEKLDKRIMKLDAGTIKIFETYNLPRNGINLDYITLMLRSIKNVTIQALFTTGPAGNFEKSHICEWLKRIREISPEFVQIYSLDRDTPCPDIMPVNKKSLLNLKAKLIKTNIKAEVF